MSAKYAALPNARPSEDIDDEMEAAFDDSDDDDDHNESRPLNPSNGSFSFPRQSNEYGSSVLIPGAYDFENVDYDYPPPGSPPRRDRALPGNDLGNTNGVIPTVPVRIAAGPQIGWLGRTAGSILPTHYAQRIGLQRMPVTGAVGGGTRNDGVFANVTAKPTPPRQIADGQSSLLVFRSGCLMF